MCFVVSSVLVLAWSLVNRYDIPPEYEYLDSEAEEGPLHANQGILDANIVHDVQLVDDGSSDMEDHWHEWLNLEQPSADGAPVEEHWQEWFNLDLPLAGAPRRRGHGH